MDFADWYSWKKKMKYKYFPAKLSWLLYRNYIVRLLFYLFMFIVILFCVYRYTGINNQKINYVILGLLLDLNGSLRQQWLAHHPGMDVVFGPGEFPIHFSDWAPAQQCLGPDTAPPNSSSFLQRIADDIGVPKKWYWIYSRACVLSYYHNMNSM